MATRERTEQELHADCDRMRRQLIRYPLSRRELSDLERALADLAAELAPMVRAARAQDGLTPAVKLAAAGLTAAEESSSWARMYRKHAPLAQRREYISVGLEGAIGVLLALRGADDRKDGPVLADGDGRSP
jgi:hypothetical protein